MLWWCLVQDLVFLFREFQIFCYLTKIWSLCCTGVVPSAMLRLFQTWSMLSPPWFKYYTNPNTVFRLLYHGPWPRHCQLLLQLLCLVCFLFFCSMLYVFLWNVCFMFLFVFFCSVTGFVNCCHDYFIYCNLGDCISYIRAV